MIPARFLAGISKSGKSGKIRSGFLEQEFRIPDIPENPESGIRIFLSGIPEIPDRNSGIPVIPDRIPSTVLVGLY